MSDWNKSKRVFFFFFFVCCMFNWLPAVITAFTAYLKKNKKKPNIFSCTFNLECVEPLDLPVHDQIKRLIVQFRLEKSYFLLSSQKILLPQFWRESPSFLLFKDVGQVPAAFWTWLSLHLNKQSWLFGRIQPWALDREVKVGQLGNKTNEQIKMLFVSSLIKCALIHTKMYFLSKTSLSVPVKTSSQSCL